MLSSGWKTSQPTGKGELSHDHGQPCIRYWIPKTLICYIKCIKPRQTVGVQLHFAAVAGHHHPQDSRRRPLHHRQVPQGLAQLLPGNDELGVPVDGRSPVPPKKACKTMAGWYSQGGRIIPGFLRRCGISSIRSITWVVKVRIPGPFGF